MGGGWSTLKLQFICFVVFILGGTSSLNLEGLILLQFRANIESDPYNSLSNWNPNDHHPCNWLGVHCVDGKVQMLNLSGLSLGGTLAPELGNLCYLRALVLRTNHLSGTIPTEIEHLTFLEVLDLRDNNLTGMIPVEIANLVSLKELLVCNNNFKGPVPPEIDEISSLSELQHDDCFGSISNRKFGVWSIGGTDCCLGPQDIPNSNFESSYGSILLQEARGVDPHTRRQLAEQSSNIEAVPNIGNNPEIKIISQPIFKSSGSFPAAGPDKGPFKASPSMPSDSDSQQVNKPGEATPNSKNGRLAKKVWVYVAVALGVIFLLLIALALYFMWRSRGAKPVGPPKTGISGQLQKAFITGAPKLNRSELETACEDFSNVVATFDASIIYKGTLSSGTEIAVASTKITSSVDWSTKEELAYRKKIELLSRLNHKNFVNLIGYCEEQKPFTRMMVFEYSPSGNLFEHLHALQVDPRFPWFVEHLDWNARVRIIMGTAYCLQYMHHDLNPPVALSKLSSAMVYLTDDYAAKLAEMPFDIVPKPKDLGGDGPLAGSAIRDGQRENVFEFGILLLEIVTGRLSYSEEEGSLIEWASKYLKDGHNKDMIDPILNSVKTNELDIICDVIQRCTETDPLRRPTIQAVTSRLREVIPLPPEAAVAHLSPLGGLN